MYIKYHGHETNKIHKNLIPQNIQTYPIVQTIIDNTIKHKHTL